MGKRSIVMIGIVAFGCVIIALNSKWSGDDRTTECKIFSDKVIVNTYDDTEIKSSTAFHENHIEQRVKRSPETHKTVPNNTEIRVLFGSMYKGTDRDIRIFGTRLPSMLYAKVDKECTDAISSIAQYHTSNY